MKNNNNIGAEIKSKLQGLDAKPDALVWQNIEKELKAKKRRRYFFIWISLLGVLVLMTPFIFSESKGTNTPEVTEIKQIENSILHKESDSNNNLTVIDSTTLDSTKSSDKLFAKQNEEKNNLKQPATYYKTQNNSSISKKDNLVSDIISPQTDSISNFKSITLVSDNTTKKDDATTAKNQDSVQQILKTHTTKKSDEKDVAKTERDSIKTHNESSRWSIMPQAFLSYYGSFNNTSKNNTSNNYGFLASYRINSKVYIRTGIRVLNLQQEINMSFNEVTYYQFPLEIKYAPFTYKINPYVLGGFSYYNLKDSNISNVSNELQATVGFNLGLGAETKLFKNTFISFESNFNYQLMPFSGQNNNKPYILNFALGLEYRF